MSLLIPTSKRFIQSPLTIVVCAVFISACSGSGSGDSQSAPLNDLDVANDLVVPANSGSGDVAGVSTDNPVSNPADNTASGISSGSINNDLDVATSTVENPSGSESTGSGAETVAIAPDLLVPETTTESSIPLSAPDSGELESLLTRVDFDITVPVYVSDSLQVQLQWGDTELSAGWVVDEIWRVSGDFASDTESLLSVNFLDRNGAIVLASYEANFRTGTSDSETVIISADQFDATPWDIDGDGISNLAESIAGTDPLAAPDPSLQNLVRVDFGATVPAIMSDALQLRLFWGDEEIEAGWVGDEFWSAFADLPAETEETLTVTFSDRDGDIPLAIYESTYETGDGSTGSEYFQIESRQFTTHRFDNDLDGVSNLRELIAETDPDVSDSSVPVTFTSINERSGGCGRCHTNYLQVSHDVLLNQISRNGENQMVVPFEPDESYIINKLEGTMFRYGGSSLAELVRAWIATGALDN